MTAEQRSVLHSARAGDLVLVIGQPPPSILRTNSNNIPGSKVEAGSPRVLLIESVSIAGTTTPRGIYFRSASSLTPLEWIAYQRHPAGLWRDFGRGHSTMGMDQVLLPSDEAVLRPSFDDLFHVFFHGHCPFALCDEGLVSVDDGYVDAVLRDFTRPARRPRVGMKTLCPFCTGVHLYRKHEREAQRTTNETSGSNYDLEQRTDHLRGINERRAQLGYRLVTMHTNFADLRIRGHRSERSRSGIVITVEPVAGEYEVATGSYRQPEPVRSAGERTIVVTVDAAAGAEVEFTSDSSISSSRTVTRPNLPRSAPREESEPVSARLRPREWYVKAARRVLAEACQICLENFRADEIIVDLPCWHFSYENCWKHVYGSVCPFRCGKE